MAAKGLGNWKSSSLIRHGRLQTARFGHDDAILEEWHCAMHIEPWINTDISPSRNIFFVALIELVEKRKQ